MFKAKRSRGRGQDLRVFFASDIHGSEVCFKKFINAGKFYEADVLILGGDITGKAMVPIARETDDRFRLQFMGAERVVDAKGLSEIEASIRFNGYYPYVCEPDKIGEMLN